LCAPGLAIKKSRKELKLGTKMIFPSLPSIQGDAALAIFVHRSLTPSVPNDTFGDGERLAFLGERVLRMVVAEIIFDKRPMLEARNLEEELGHTLTDDVYDQWVSHYGIRDRVACPKNLREELKEPAETRHVFHAYVGALYIEKGYRDIKAWVAPLIDPEFSPPPSGFPVTNFANPPPPSYGAPPLPQSPPAPGGQRMASLALFNEMAMQRGLRLEWNANQSGPGHSLIWVVHCLVNGVLKGEGEGKSKQKAKEEAAIKAFHAMGWAAAASGPY
jgi:ribonuclease-3